MSANGSFALLSLNDEDYTLTVQWLPLVKPMLLIGISTSRTDGRAAIINPADARLLSDAVGGKTFVSIEAPIGVSATPDNRGEPYRDGMDISIFWEEFENISVFVEERDLAELALFLARGGATPT
jgi:hypothetical protein